LTPGVITELSAYRCALIRFVFGSASTFRLAFRFRLHLVRNDVNFALSNNDDNKVYED